MQPILRCIRDPISARRPSVSAWHSPTVRQADPFRVPSFVPPPICIISAVVTTTGVRPAGAPGQALSQYGDTSNTHCPGLWWVAQEVMVPKINSHQVNSCGPVASLVYFCASFCRCPHLHLVHEELRLRQAVLLQSKVADVNTPIQDLNLSLIVK